MRKIRVSKKYQQFLTATVVVSFIASTIVGSLLGGFFAFYLVKTSGNIFKADSAVQVVSQEERVVAVVKQASPAVVSIIVTKDLPVIQRYYDNYDPFNDEFFRQFFGDDFFAPFEGPGSQGSEQGTEKREIGGGTGFIVSADGLILTNKHVVSDSDADYTVLTNDGERIEATVLASDPLQDIAVLKIERNNLPIIELGDSDRLDIGQSVIAIGNALGEFSNSVSTGIVSGLMRSITTADGSGQTEELSEVIQTDAAINRGNSGGPLLNLEGKAIGINVAMAQSAENIGFSIPINLAKRDLKQVQAEGKISYPYLGVRYLMISEEVKEKNDLSVDDGALVISGNSSAEPAVMPGSSADQAGLKENDIILEIDGQKVTQNKPLSKIITSYMVGDKVELKILRQDKEETISATLGEWE